MAVTDTIQEGAHDQHIYMDSDEVAIVDFVKEREEIYKQT